ncbi:unnamed protein product [Calypogeia fissa]
MVLSKGDAISLIVDGVEVASGIVHRTNVDDTVHGVPLGINRIGVIVESILKGTYRLPYPSWGAGFLSEALDTCVIWDSACAFLKSSTNVQGIRNLDNTFVFKEGDEVDMFLLGVLVAKGVVFKTNPTDTCHGEILGEGRISVCVGKVFNGSSPLPYKHPGADTIEEALHSWVIWDCLTVLKCDDLRGHIDPITDSIGINISSISQPEHEIGSGLSQEQNVNGIKDSPICTNSGGKDLSDRSNWMSEDVILFCPDRSLEVAKGVITLSFPSGVVDDQLLGDHHVGVAVEKVFISSFFPNIHPGVPGLVRWPIHCTKLITKGKFIGDIVEAAVESFDSPGRDGLDPNQSDEYMQAKRPYNYIKRTKVDLEEKRRKVLASKAVSKSTGTSIDELVRHLCCKSKCCLMMPREVLEDVRKEFHGMSANGKTDHILNLLTSREDDVKRKGLLVLKGQLICKEAFWEIHGFSRTQFYLYKANAESGCKLGFQRNKGLPKTRENTMVARACLEAILTENAEPMPHISYGGKHGSDNIEYRLPSCLTKKDIFGEVAMKMTLDGLTPVAEATLYSIWNTSFDNFSFHKQSAFAKCTLCVQFKDQLMREK